MPYIFPSKNDILHAMTNQVCYKSVELIGGTILKTGTWVTRTGGGYASVFPFTKANGQKIVVRCWFADIDNAKKRMLSISSHLSKLNCQYFVKFDFHEDALLINGKLQPIVTMDYVGEPTLKEYLKDNIDNPSKILTLATNFRIMVYYLHKQNIAHGDLSDGNIKVRHDGSLILIDYDSMYVQDLHGMRDIINGIKGYQHPAREDNKIINPKLDYFSELVIYLSLLVYADYPDLFNKYYETEDLLFSRADYEFPNSSELLTLLKKSPNQKIVNLINELTKCLNYDDISNLKPLEEILNMEFDNTANNIIDKF